jgi:hypothetical protein
LRVPGFDDKPLASLDAHLRADGQDVVTAVVEGALMRAIESGPKLAMRHPQHAGLARLQGDGAPRPELPGARQHNRGLLRLRKGLASHGGSPVGLFGIE